jgi:Tol biopolymer transport system component
MTHRYSSRATQLLFAAVFLSACGGGGDSTAPTGPGSLDVNVVTTGADIDADGFLLTIDAQPPKSIPANGTLTISQPAGSHTLAVSGHAINCDFTAAPATVNVAAATATRVDVRASCTPYLQNMIVFVSDEYAPNTLMVMRPSGARRERLTTDQKYYLLPAVSPDGQSIAVESGDATSDDGIVLLDRFGRGRTGLVKRSNTDGAPAWSPDGTKLAFRSRTSISVSEDRIFIINRDGTGLRQLTIENNPMFGSTNDNEPSWSPDGQQIVFSRTGLLYLINVDGTGIDSTGVIGRHPAWSPDGTQIAFADGAIYVMDMTFKTRRLTASGGDFMPRWSPDGRQLVFERTEGLQYKLYRINSDGTGLTKLSTAAPSDNWPTWSPLP